MCIILASNDGTRSTTDLFGGNSGEYRAWENARIFVKYLKIKWRINIG